MKNIKIKLIAIFSALAAGAFFILRFILVKEPKTSDDFPQTQKKALEKEKKNLEQSQSDLDKKVYSDEEIEKKYNS